MSTLPSGPRRIAIIGAGFSGLCLGMQLKRAGIHSFVIFEKADRLGGTWRDNTYPGAACDSPSFAYCFSFEQKTDWSRKWAEQPEILAYMEHCARKYGLLPHIRFGAEVEDARFDAEAGSWRLRAGGEEESYDLLVSSVGQLNRPHVPEISGLETFEGPRFHSARWDHDVDLGGKRVAVIGNAASAIQFIPRIAEQASQLHVFQRSANWMLPKQDREFSEAERRRFARFPWLARLYRWWIWASFESRWPVFRGNRFLGGRIEEVGLREMREAVHDPALQSALVPEYPVGGKRILISDDYYATLDRDDVEVVRTGIDHLMTDAVVTRDGRVRDVDVVILATGFETTGFLVPMEIEGLDGRNLQQEWDGHASAYLGMTYPGFPNFFMTYGPNTNLGHNSILFMIECQTNYILHCLRRIVFRDLAWLDVRREVHAAYQAEIQRELANTVWARTDRSWYKTADGTITNNWSGSVTRYWWRTRRPDFSAYHEVPRKSAAAARDTALRGAVAAG